MIGNWIVLKIVPKEKNIVPVQWNTHNNKTLGTDNTIILMIRMNNNKITTKYDNNTFFQPYRASISLPNSARRWRIQAFAHCLKDLIKLSVDGCIQYTTIINGAFFITIEMTFVFVHVFWVKCRRQPVFARPAASLLAILYPVRCLGPKRYLTKGIWITCPHDVC